jgi:hypothetical protein
MNTKDKKLTSIRLNKNLYKHLQEKAKEENRSLNNYIETLLWDSSNFRAPNDDTLAAMKEVQDHVDGKIFLEGKKDGESVKEYLKRIINE